MSTHLLHNRYELLEKIGDGGMATVYKARCTLLDRIVAVKILKEEFAHDRSFVMKFRSEAQAAARISHPNIVNVYDVGEDRGYNFIIMEYVEGRNLKQVIQSDGPMPPAEITRISGQICDALTHAHEKGIVHRDIKPHNIIFTAEGNVKVADFGIARAAGGETITYSGKMVGSVHYVSPEQARGQAVDRRSDLYSLGCVMYEMATGKVPFDADSAVTIALKHIHEDPVPPSVLNDTVTNELEWVILTAIEKDPNKRFQSAQEFKQALSGNLPVKLKTKKRDRDLDKTRYMQTVNGNEGYQVPGKRKFRSTAVMVVLLAALALASGFLWGMRGSLWGGSEVEVPNLINMTAADARKEIVSKGLKYVEKKRINSADVKAGRVMSQEPNALEKVKKGREVKVVLSLGASMVKVPNLVGKNLENASMILANKDLGVGEIGNGNDPELDEGVIISQSPDAGDKTAKGSKVDVTVNRKAETGETAMKNLVGMYLSDAKSAALADGLVIENVDRRDSESYFPGQVISQSISAGKNFVKGDKLTLVVSNGPGPLPKKYTIEYTMPASADYSVLSISLSDAKGKREVYNNTHLGGYVVTQEIEYSGKATIVYYVDGQEVKRQELN